MLRIKNKLTVFHDDNSSFSDYSEEALDYDRDTFSMSLHQSEDYLYVGFYKPINGIYVELGTANTNDGSFTVQYYNGSTWAAVTGLLDETKSFQRSGFIRWDSNLTDNSEVEINSTTKYYVRFRPSATHSATVVNGLNIVFCDDQDLKREIFEISSSRFYPSGESSHILSCVAARDEIIQDLRNDGKYKQNLATGNLKDITAFDILDMGQIRLSATYLAISKIYDAVADDPDGFYEQKAARFYSKYKKAIPSFYLDLDYDDDGTQDNEERMADNAAVLVRR